MKIENFSTAVLMYAETQVIGKIHNSLERWLTYAGLFIKMPELERKIQDLLPTLVSFGAVNESGDADLDKLRSVGLAAFERVPKVEIASFDFDRNDFETFIDFLATQG